MLTSLGSSESIVSSASCCDICSGLCVSLSRLDFLNPMPLKRSRKPKPVRHISDGMADALKRALVCEREKVMNEFPGYKMIGSSFLLCNTIRELCDVPKTVRSVGDLDTVVSLRPELKNRFFHVLWGIVACAPPPKKKQRKS